jgi:hypothetical protein
MNLGRKSGPSCALVCSSLMCLWPLLSCTPDALQTAQVQVSHRSPSRQDGAVVPDKPHEFRYLHAREAEKAAKLLAHLSETTPALDERNTLVTTYSELGFLAASSFFANTLAYHDGRPLDVGPFASPVAWAEEGSDGISTSQEQVRSVRTLFDSQRYSEAASEALRGLAVVGPAPALTVEWANAVLWQHLLEPGGVSADLYERSIRILLTGFEKHGLRPLGYLNEAEMYGHLSLVFDRRGDALSAATAAALALLWDQDGSADSLSSSLRVELCRRSRAGGGEASAEWLAGLVKCPTSL